MADRAGGNNFDCVTKNSTRKVEIEDGITRKYSKAIFSNDEEVESLTTLRGVKVIGSSD